MTVPLVRPATIVEPFANSGEKNTIPIAPEGLPGRASLELGFPPITMTAITDGGVPPSGLDFNGILNLITQHTAWQNAGGVYRFDGALCAYIGGYPAGAVLQSNDGLASYVSAVDGNTTDFNATPGSIGTLWLPYAGEAVAQIDSPTFTGDPKVPTPAFGDNDKSIANTEFVQAAMSSASTPKYELYFIGQI